MFEKLKAFFSKLPEVKEQANAAPAVVPVAEEKPVETPKAEVTTPTFIQQLEQKAEKEKKPRKPRSPRKPKVRKVNDEPKAE